MNINVEVSLHDAFKATAALPAFIEGYIKENAVQVNTGRRG